MTELGIGYITIAAQTSGIPRQIQSALDGSQAGADRTGQGIGSKLASGIGKTLKVGAVGAGVAAGGVLATSIAKGLSRLNSIEQAQAKLTGLGNSASAVGNIMDNALASVKGTAFGLGDAAAVAASAVAAGVKPGQDLERTLKLTGDAATIAGAGMGEMGAIFNKVAASNKIQGDVIAQLNDKGIPIIQLLGAELGTTAEETLKLASEGKVNFETFQNAMEKGLGGAALKSGETVKGSLDNMGAALGRFGATIAGPAFRQAAGGFGLVTSAIDDLEARAKPVMETFEADLTGRYIPALAEFGTSVRDGFEQFRNSDLVVSSMGRIGAVFDSMVSTARSLGPSLAAIGTSLATASAATGVSTWQVLLSVLESVGPILDATLVPALSAMSSLMTNNQTAVNALAIGFLAFKTIPGLLTPVAARMGALTAQTAAAAVSTRAMATAQQGMIRVAGYGTTTLGRFGTTIQQLGQRAPAVAGMQQAFGNAAAGAQRFGRTAGTVAAASAGLASGVRGISSAVGGPWVIGIAAATAVTVGMVREFGKAEKQTAALDAATSTAAASQRRLTDALVATAGEVDDTVLDAATQGLEDYHASQVAVIANGPGMFSSVTAGLRDIGGWFSGTAEAGTDALRTSREVTDAAKETKAQFDELGYSSDELGEKITGSTAAFDTFIASLRSDGMNAAADELVRQRGEFDKLQESMQRIGGSSLAVTAGLEEIAGAAGDGDKKLSGLRKTLENLGILESDAQAAFFEAADTVREIVDAAATVADASGGLGEDLVDSFGQVDWQMGNAKEFRDNLMSIGSEFQSLRTNGATTQEALDALAPALEATGSRFGFTAERVAELAGQFEFLPEETEIALSVDGGDAAFKTIADVALQMGALEDGEPKTIKMRVEDEQARQALENLGLDVEVINATTGEIQVTANNEVALVALERVRTSVAGLNISVADPRITADTTAFVLHNQDTIDALDGLDRSSASPEINAVIDDFINGRDVTLAELNKLDLENAKPSVVLLIEEALARAKVVNDAIDRAARNRRTRIELNEVYGVGSRRANDGVARSEFATGGRLPTTGPGTNTRDGILAVSGAGKPIAHVDAGEWVINGRSSDRYDRELAAINAGTFPKLPGYADGGKVGVTSEDLLALARGELGNKPLEGAGYDFGGVHWGDCSSTGSALARFAVGLPAFASRFATATAASALSALGFSRGMGGPGDLRIGWMNGGPGGGHMASTLPDGTKAEMGGARGNGQLGGGAAGHDSPSFTDHAYITVAQSITPIQESTDTELATPSDPETTTTPAETTPPASTRSLATPSTASTSTSWSQLAGDAVGSAVSAGISGQISDALGVFGIPDQLPGAVQAFNLYRTAMTQQAAEQALGSKDPDEEQLKRLGYHNGGPVIGPSGRDKVPAWLEAKEYVVNATAAQSGANPAILAAINGGTKFSMGRSQQSSGPTFEDIERMIKTQPVVHYHVTDIDAAMRKENVRLQQASLTYRQR